ncbi:phosphoesterase [archaeon CG10_big_fil_rev_8_21_14_0_10_43_11]|nr:MAG: phosphoesterase [archaeon CG10_big_fil_rev_8_21_14_0_10_43_11]
MTTNLCIYHKNCIDGTTSAAVFLTKFPNSKTIPFDYNYTQSNIQSLANQLDLDTHLYLIDFSFKPEQIQTLLDTGAHLTILDHHVGVNKTLEQIKHECFAYTFDNNESGTSIAWKHFFGEPVPRLVELVKDRDIWAWKHGDETKHANNYLSLFINKPEKMKEVLKQDAALIIERGSYMSAYADDLVHTLETRLTPVTISVGEYVVLAYNTPLFHSEVGHYFAKKNKQAVAVFSYIDDGVKVSFRGQDNDKPLAREIAELLGGGGHDNAASARVSVKQFIDMIVL